MGGGSFAPPGKARSPKSGNGRAPRAPPTSFDAALSPAAPAVRPGARRDGANERCPARRFLHAGRGLRFEEPARRPGPARRSRLATRQRICSPVRVFSSAPRNGRRALTAMDGVRGYPAVPVLSRDGCGGARFIGERRHAGEVGRDMPGGRPKATGTVRLAVRSGDERASVARPDTVSAGSSGRGGHRSAPARRSPGSPEVAAPGQLTFGVRPPFAVGGYPITSRATISPTGRGT